MKKVLIHVCCTRQTIIALEQGKYVPSITLAFKIARAFGVTLEEVFQYEEITQIPVTVKDKMGARDAPLF